MTDDPVRTESIQEENENLSELLAIRRGKLRELCASGRDPFEITRYERTHWSKQVLENFDALENAEVSVCGRIMSMRGMGKASFFHIQDGMGTLQLYVRVNDVGEEEYARFKNAQIATCEDPFAARYAMRGLFIGRKKALDDFD